jgi:peptidyl-prolyl cis-trans isomerase D
VFNSKKNQLGVRIMLGFIVGILGAGMLVYLIPGQGTASTPTADVVANVGDGQVTVNDVRTQLTRIQSSGTIPPALQSLYAQQVLNQLVFARELESEAQRLGIEVTDQERADRIRELVPTAFVGDTFVGLDQYAAQIQQRAGMSVPEFEDLITQGMIEEKFRQLVTGGVTVTPLEIQQEFRRRNEKVKLDYVLIKPDDLQAKIQASDADLAAYFEKNRARYAVPERRTVRYAMLDMDQLRARQAISDDAVRSYYDSHLDTYKLPDRSHVAHILFKTVGKTDAEAEEIRKKAEDVLKQAKSGKDFAALAKQYSEDTSKDKGGDIDWIVRGQTVPEFEAVAFSLPKGSVSDLVKTQYGFHIIKVIDRENARTQTVDEVRPMIMAALQAEKAQQAGTQISDQIAADIRSSGRVPLEDLAKKYGMTIGETQPLEAGATIAEIGNSPEIADDIFRLRQGDDSAPIQTDKGYVVLTLKEVQAAHAGTLTEVHDKVLADYRREKAVELAKSNAADLARRVKGGEELDKTAKSLGLDAKASELLARIATVPDVGPMSQLPAAFTLANGQTADPVFLGANWVVYRVVDHQQPNPADLAGKAKDDIEQQLLDGKREMAFEAFHAALDARMKQSGQLRINADNLKLIENANQSSQQP